MSHVNLTKLYQEAVTRFPYLLEATSISQGDLRLSDGFVEYGAEYTFTAGQLLTEQITAGGWIELHQMSPTEEMSIRAIFSLARAGDWQNGRILPETMAVQGYYDLKTKSWELAIDYC